MCACEGIVGTIAASMWTSAVRTPPLWPDAITLAPGVVATRVVAVIETAGARCSVNDSFADLDLSAHGFHPLFGATWIALEPSAPPPSAPGCAQGSTVTSQGELERWITAWGDSALFRFSPDLLDDPRARFLAGHRDGDLLAGAIAFDSDGVVGISNLFAPERAQVEVWSEVAQLLLGVPAVRWWATRAATRWRRPRPSVPPRRGPDGVDHLSRSATGPGARWGRPSATGGSPPTAALRSTSPVTPAAGPRALAAYAPVDLDAAALGQMASIVLDTAPLGLVLQRRAGIAERTIPGATAVSVTVVRGPSASSAGFTGAVAAALDERQYQAGFGPCLDAAATTTGVVIADTTSSEAYPGFGTLAAEHGVGSVVAIGLAVAGPATAALNVYRAGLGGADPAAMTATVRTARVFAAYAAVAVSNAAAMDAERSTSAQMSTAMASRAGIEQAKGVLIAQWGIAAGAAFELLAATSQDPNIKLAEVAAQVVATASSDGSAQDQS